MQKQILITNDDGIDAPGLFPLINNLKGLGKITTIVPDHERSAVSHSLTLHKPLRLRKVKPGVYTLNGTPADCVRFGVLHLLAAKPDLVVSGINSGINLGEDVIYSGTVAGAMEGAMLDIPSIAVSHPPSQRSKDFIPAAQFARKISKAVLDKGLPKGLCLNVNVPALKNGNGRVPKFKAIPAGLGHRLYGNKITIRLDPRGNQYYWLLAKNVLGVSIPGSDVEALKRGMISITPLQLDWTAQHYLPELKKWKF